MINAVARNLLSPTESHTPTHQASRSCRLQRPLRKIKPKDLTREDRNPKTPNQGQMAQRRPFWRRTAYATINFKLNLRFLTKRNARFCRPSPVVRRATLRHADPRHRPAEPRRLSLVLSPDFPLSADPRRSPARASRPGPAEAGGVGSAGSRDVVLSRRRLGGRFVCSPLLKAPENFSFSPQLILHPPTPGITRPPRSRRQ